MLGLGTGEWIIPIKVLTKKVVVGFHWMYV